MRICAVVTGKNLDEMLNNLEEVQKVADMIEIRFDHLEKSMIKDLELIHKNINKESVFTFRHKDHGGNFEGDFEQQLEIYKKADELGFDFMDVDLPNITKVKKHIKNSKVIVSHHNFEKTPENKVLNYLKKQMVESKADIYKFAVKVNSETDSKRLLSLLLGKSEGEEMIVIGMGEEGKVSRIIAPLLGSFLTFGSVGNSFSAPGQIEVEELKKIYAKLEEIVSIRT